MSLFVATSSKDSSKMQQDLVDHRWKNRSVASAPSHFTRAKITRPAFIRDVSRGLSEHSFCDLHIQPFPKPSHSFLKERHVLYTIWAPERSLFAQITVINTRVAGASDSQGVQSQWLSSCLILTTLFPDVFAGEVDTATS